MDPYLDSETVLLREAIQRIAMACTCICSRTHCALSIPCGPKDLKLAAAVTPPPPSSQRNIRYNSLEQNDKY